MINLDCGCESSHGFRCECGTTFCGSFETTKHATAHIKQCPKRKVNKDGIGWVHSTKITIDRLPH